MLRATDIDDDGHIVGSGVLRRLPIGKLTLKCLLNGDILLEGSGGGPDKPVGRVAFFDALQHPEVAVCSNFFKTLRPNLIFVEPRFLLHKLSWFYRQPILLTFQQQTTGIINLKFEEYLEAFIDLPCDLKEQRGIALVLDTLDTAIHETESIIAKLKAIKQGLLHDLLTRGINANGELRPPQSEAPHLYKESPLGWIPKGWDVAPTTTRCTLITKGATPSTHKMWQGSEGIRFLRVDNLSFDGRFDLNASTFRVSAATHNGFLARSKCQPGDVLTNIVGPPLGKLGLVTEESGEININQAVALFRPTEKLLSRFFLIWLSSEISQAWLKKRAKQTSGQVNLTLALCQELPLLCMATVEQQAIVDMVHTAQMRINFEEDQLGKLHFEKSGLMDDLLTGRVRVTPLLTDALS
ncbi:MAG: restriction endonuclease subunit S [Magnetococcales bacterium]|nr:restriction endonuclease subunit S [Magnetococcales bacterium]